MPLDKESTELRIAKIALQTSLIGAATSAVSATTTLAQTAEKAIEAIQKLTWGKKPAGDGEDAVDAAEAISDNIADLLSQ